MRALWRTAYSPVVVLANSVCAPDGSSRRSGCASIGCAAAIVRSGFGLASAHHASICVSRCSIGGLRPIYPQNHSRFELTDVAISTRPARLSRTDGRFSLGAGFVSKARTDASGPNGRIFAWWFAGLFEMRTMMRVMR